MMFRLIQISENTGKLSEQFKAERRLVPWKSIYGLRNKIVHDYGNVNFKIVYETLTADIPDLKESILKVC